MPSRVLAARALAEVFKVIAHPDRIRVIEELRAGECDVSALATKLDLPPTRVSQHLSLLRLHRLVDERREGRHHHYRLTLPAIAEWIVEGLAFVHARESDAAASELRTARELWLQGQPQISPFIERS